MKKNRIYIILFVVLAAAATILYLNKSNTTINKAQADFAVKDTASIDKIFMADRKGNTVVLERKSRSQWLVNNHFEARQDGINTLLTTVASMEVRSPVGKNLYNNTMKLLASNSTKVELYADGKLLKTFYVGHATMDNLGTFMYLEGSSVPFIMHIPGFNGYLTPRFFVSENGWRRRIIFAYEPALIKSVQVTDILQPDSGFIIQRQGDSVYTVTSASGAAVQPVSKEKTRSYIVNFKVVGYESIDEKDPKEVRDSILKVGPFKKLAIASVDGRVKEVLAYRRPIMENSMNKVDPEGNPLPYDKDNLYVMIQGDPTLYLCQYFTWDKLLKTPSYFKASGSTGK
ncbi:MAG: hypothetical protein ABI772_13470 [Bacteroidota bacterium]